MQAWSATLFHAARIGSSMDLPVQVPVCPLGLGSALAQHLRINGWIWDDEALLTVVNQLAREDVCDVRDLVGLNIADIPEAERWPLEVKEFLVKVIETASLRRITEAVTSRLVTQADKRPRIEEALSLTSRPTLLLNVRSATPLEALELLHRNLPRDEASLREWRHGARVAAVMGSCPRSKTSFKSGLFCFHAPLGADWCACAVPCISVTGLRHWIRFIEITHGKRRADAVALPPDLLDVLAWSNTFRCLGTFANYLGHLRCACHALGLDAPPIGHQAIKRAMAGIVKRQLHDPRPKMFITKYMPLIVMPPLRSLAAICMHLSG